MNDATQSSNERLWRDLFEEKGAAESLGVLLREAALKRKARARKRQLYLVAAAGVLGLLAISWWAMPGNGFSSFARGNKSQSGQESETVAKQLPPNRRIPLAPPRQQDEVSPALAHSPAQANSPLVANAPGKANANEKPASRLDIPGVKTLSDEELLDRIRGTPIALVGPKGHRRAIFLNEVAARVSTKPQAEEESSDSWE